METETFCARCGKKLFGDLEDNIIQNITDENGNLGMALMTLKLPIPTIYLCGLECFKNLMVDKKYNDFVKKIEKGFLPKYNKESWEKLSGEEQIKEIELWIK